jgi:very-short-patch-repair endonuclease
MFYDGELVTITKRPLLCIEVDGWQFHHTEVQRHRDAIKDEILDKYGLKLVRLSTTSVVTIDTIKDILIRAFKA